MKAPGGRPVKLPIPLPVEEQVVTVLLIGWLLAAAATLPAHRYPVFAAACAFWLAFVMLAVAAWDLWVTMFGGRPLEPFDPGRGPAWLRSWMVPCALVAGLLFGHWVW
jgi:hypothetical protein